eukprot:CAMPEP_0203667884 /NCGR_PEP_ID=MMETSP0090-20130426/4622_1 /ASSEMBLY_ACC=CAM_ASM_001088 /TAXON_ID=426623 /ORGANISM="Chaetoceros affinis, Strain CCMP159" /LENGTH=354 /DNA_ID=CAMNT_0050532163 /DNA_START=45 /DNA_END=1109 /DNA_ORIENTATION=-
MNALQRACYNNASIEVVSKLIEVGGIDIIMEQDGDGWNSLQYAIKYGASIDVVSKLVEVGQKDVVMAKNNDGGTSLHVVCAKDTSVGERLVDLLVRQGGADLLMERDASDRTPLHLLITKDAYGEYVEGHVVDYTPYRDIALLLINKGIQLHVGGEYGIGGLFNSHTRTNNEETKPSRDIYWHWDEVVFPVLERLMAQPNNRNQPILHALIMDNAYPCNIKECVNSFTGSVNTIDSLGRYPIDIAVRHGLAWDDGMQTIVGLFASTNRISALHVCAKHGVQWENGMKNVLGRSGRKIVKRVDASTGLYPFMLAAVGGKYSYDLGSVYHLIKKDWELFMIVKKDWELFMSVNSSP